MLLALPLHDHASSPSLHLEPLLPTFGLAPDPFHPHPCIPANLQRCMALAMAAFDDTAVGDESIKKAHMEKFKQVGPPAGGGAMGGSVKKEHRSLQQLYISVQRLQPAVLPIFL